MAYDVIVLQQIMDAIKAEPNSDAVKAEPNSEDETHPSDIDTQQIDAKQDPSEPFTFVEVKCEIEVGPFSEA
jgi:hypothetical protein